MFQVVVWKEPALLAIGHLSIFYEESRVVMQDGDVRDERVLRATVRSHSESRVRVIGLRISGLLKRGPVNSSVIRNRCRTTVDTLRFGRSGEYFLFSFVPRRE